MGKLREIQLLFLNAAHRRSLAEQPVIVSAVIRLASANVQIFPARRESKVYPFRAYPVNNLRQRNPARAYNAF